MASQKIEELIAELAELDVILGLLKRPRNIDTISLKKETIETERTQLAQKNQLATITTNPQSNESKRYESEIVNYIWDESEKFVKLFIGLEGVQHSPEENVIVKFTHNSILLNVADIQDKDHKFEVKNLLHSIDVEKSYRKIKTNSIAIYAKKANEGMKWSFLTVTEKGLDDIKNTRIQDDIAKDNPNAGSMKVVQSMYEQGDAETKRIIAKAWDEAEQQMKADFKLS